MAKYYGKIGFIVPTEVEDSIWVDQVTEKNYSGDLIRHYNGYQETSGQVNDRITLNHEISIVANAFARENIGFMRYITYRGARWSISKIEDKYPRFIITVGGIYNGPSPQTT